MKTRWLVSGLVLSALFQANPSAAAEKHPAPQPSPFACDRTALDAQERRRHFDELGPRLKALRRGTRELADGYAFEFASDRATVRLLMEWMIQERACCPFFDLSLTLDSDGGAAWLSLRGRQGVKEFVRAELPEAWFAPKR